MVIIMSLDEIRKRTISDFVKTYIEGIMRVSKCRLVIESEDLDLDMIETGLKNTILKEMKLLISKQGNTLIIDNKLK